MSIQTLEFPLLDEEYYQKKYNVTLHYNPFNTKEHCYSIQYLNQPHEIFVTIIGNPRFQQFSVKDILTDGAGKKQMGRTLKGSFSTLGRLIPPHQKLIKHTVPHYEF